MNISLNASPPGLQVGKLVGVVALLGVAFAIQAALVLLTELEINGFDYLATAAGSKELHNLRSSLVNVCFATLGMGAMLYWHSRWAYGFCLAFLIALTGITLYFSASHLPALAKSRAFWAGSVLPLLLLSAAAVISHRLRYAEARHEL
jgi:hypothetical protein